MRRAGHDFLGGDGGRQTCGQTEGQQEERRGTAAHAGKSIPLVGVGKAPYRSLPAAVLRLIPLAPVGSPRTRVLDRETGTDYHQRHDNGSEA
jgi:hypothetical protein